MHFLYGGKNSIHRRAFLSGAAALLAGSTLIDRAGAAGALRGLKALAFDGFALFDSAPVFALAETFVACLEDSLAFAGRKLVGTLLVLPGSGFPHCG